MYFTHDYWRLGGQVIATSQCTPVACRSQWRKHALVESQAEFQGARGGNGMSKAKLQWSDEDARQVLARYEGIVRRAARKLRPAASLGHALDEEDLHAEGRVAVLEALSTYKRFGIAETTWVRTRVRQRMIDAIRKLDLRTRDEMRLAVRHSNGETQSAEEQRKGRAIAARRLISLDATVEDQEPMVARLVDHDTMMADALAYGADQRRRLVEALERLPDRQRKAIELALFEGMALKQIGGIMGISESRVCQLQKRAVEHLSKAVRDQKVRRQQAA